MSSSKGVMVWLAATLTVVLWASVYLALKVSLFAFSPGEVAFLRSFLGSIVLIVHARVVGMSLPASKYWREISIIGVVGFFLYPMLLNYGQLFVDAGTTSLIINAAPAITALIAVLFMGERLPRLVGLGVVISLVGVAINGFASQAGQARATIIGVGLLLGAALARALHFLLQRRSLQTLTALQVTFCSMLVGTVCLAPWAGSSVAAVSTAPLKCLLAVAYLGIFPSAIAYATWAFVLARMPASVATNILSLIPVLAVAMAAVFLDERPPPLVLLGGLLTLAGVLLVQSRRI